MLRKLLMIALLPVMLTLAGCVVVIGTEADDGVYWGDEHYEGGIRHDGERLSRRVARAIAADGALVAEEIRVSSDDDTVVLRGQVHGTDTLERALTVARGVEGVDRVVSKMTVDGD